MQTVRIEASTPYDVRIGAGAIEHLGAWAREVLGKCRAAIVTDATVNALYGEATEASLRAAGMDPIRFAFPAGERNKRLSTLEDILEWLAENQITRADAIVALGGGVPGDVAGFAAAVYARGIRFVQVPTTLLAAVDSSVGGKTAVDLRAGKNLAGSFHQPSLVVTDTAVMRALPSALLADGAAEIIKYGVLADAELFARMRRSDWTDDLGAIIARSVAIKRDFVRADEFDTGARRMLNLGHTFGHAIEKCSGFALSHGQGVAIGMAIAAGAAGERALCAEILDANRNCGLPTRCPYPADVLARAARTDKKRAGDRIALILPERVGKCRVETIDVSELEDAFRRGIAAMEAAS